jgi:iron complex transport system substrate-binding protein
MTHYTGKMLKESILDFFSTHRLEVNSSRAPLFKRLRVRNTPVDPSTAPQGAEKRVFQHPARFIARVCIFALLPIGVAPVSAAQVTDDTGRVVSLARPAQRIISLAPHTTELLFAAGAGERVVGVVDFSDFPEAARQLPRVGNSGALDLERILALRPDLIVGWRSGNPMAALERLSKFGIPVFLSEPRRIEDIPANIDRLGELSGTTEIASRESERFRDEAAALRARYSQRRSVRVFYQIWDRPLITVNGEHMISAVLNLCGGVNVFAALGPLAPEVSVEGVLGENPAAILIGDSAERQDGVKFWSRWPALHAVKHGRVYRVPPDHMQRQSPRILLGARRVCEILEEVRTQRDGR